MQTGSAALTLNVNNGTFKIIHIEINMSVSGGVSQRGIFKHYDSFESPCLTVLCRYNSETQIL